MSSKLELLHKSHVNTAEVQLHNVPFRKVPKLSKVQPDEILDLATGRLLVLSFDYHGTLTNNPQSGLADTTSTPVFTDLIDRIRERHAELVTTVNTSGRNTVQPIPGFHLLEGGGIRWTSDDLRIRKSLQSEQDEAEWIDIYERFNTFIGNQPKSGVSCEVPHTFTRQPKVILEELISPKEALKVVVYKREKDYKIRPRFEKSDALKKLVTELGYQSDRAVYVHFGDDLTDLPVDPIPSPDYFVIMPDSDLSNNASYTVPISESPVSYVLNGVLKN